MQVCFSGKSPYQPKKDVATTHIIPIKGTLLCIGNQCTDGRPIRESWKYKEALRLGCRIVRSKPNISASSAKEEDDFEEVNTATQSFADKYRPLSLKQIIGHRSEIDELRTWLANWSTTTSRAVLIYGPPGIGKTTVAHLLAAEAGYTVAEYNASDARSVSKLQGIFALGMKRLGKELIIMDEVDGLSERGGVAEVVGIVKRTLNPIICIANEVGPKLNTLKSACHSISFSRPVRGTIANALLHVCTTEKINTTKAAIETLCEKNGNDIRAILNQLEFNRGDPSTGAGNKDASHSLTPFRAAGTLLSCGDTISWERAADMVFYDPFLVPMMVQEGYLGSHMAAGVDIESAADASDWISRGDIMNKRLMRTQDWSLLPQVVATTVAAARIVKGRAPSQIFPQLLGKMSKRAKHLRWLEDMGRRVGGGHAPRMRMEYLDTLRTVTYHNVCAASGASELKNVVQMVKEMGLTREDMIEVMDEIKLSGSAPIEIPSKTKSAFTREWNKQIGVGSKRKVRVVMDDSEEEDSEEDDPDVDELEKEMATLDLD